MNLVTPLADRADAPDDLVARQAGVKRVLPLVPGLVQVGMADAAILDVDPDVLRAGVAALEAEGTQRLVGGCGRETYAGEHGKPRSLSLIAR